MALNGPKTHLPGDAVQVPLSLRSQLAPAAKNHFLKKIRILNKKKKEGEDGVFSLKKEGEIGDSKKGKCQAETGEKRAEKREKRQNRMKRGRSEGNWAKLRKNGQRRGKRGGNKGKGATVRKMGKSEEKGSRN